MTTQAPEAALHALMLAGLEGDASAHRTLLKELSPYLRAYFRRHLLGRGTTAENAEDLVQETLIAIHTRRQTYHRSQPLTPWVYAIARHKLIDGYRRIGTSPEFLPIAAAADVTTDDGPAPIESNLDIETLLKQLPVKVRQAVRKMKLEGLTAGELAAETGSSPSAAKVAVHRGLRALSALVKGELP